MRIPLISIVMPFKDVAPFLATCLDSILAQDDIHWELIAVNDGSIDGSEKILKNYADSDQRIFLCNNTGRGIPDALRTGYQYVQGQIIHRMDADDIMPQGKLSTLSLMLKRGSVTTGCVRYFSQKGLGEGYRRYEREMNGILIHDLHHIHLYRECFLPSPNWMMYREDFEKIGGFDSTRMPEDYDLYFRILKNHLKINATEKVTHLWRDRTDRTSRVDPQYQPLQFIPLKVHYFLELSRDRNRPLVLLGAGKKGKRTAEALLKKGTSFHWVTNNRKKVGKAIFGKVLESESRIMHLTYPQAILGFSAPTDVQMSQFILQSQGLNEGRDYWRFF